MGHQEIRSDDLVEIRRAPGEVVNFWIGEINVMSQIRPSRNPVYGDLVRAIDAEGLLSEVHAAVVERDTLLKYREFTERLWGIPEKRSRLRPIVSHPEYAGKYLLLLAGESRYLAIKQLARQQRVKYGVPCKIYQDVRSIDQFISIQASENIHSSPPPERVARAYAESYLWSKAENPGLSKKAFRDKNGITRTALDNALAYASLPEWVRSSITDHQVPFTVAVEIAKSHSSLMILRCLQRSGKAQPEQMTPDEAVLVSADLQADMAHALTQYLERAKRQATMALKMIRAERSIYHTALENLLHDTGLKQRQSLILFSVDYPQLEMERRIGETRQMLKDFRATNGRAALSLCNALARIVGEPIEGPWQQDALDVISLAERILMTGAQ